MADAQDRKGLMARRLEDLRTLRDEIRLELHLAGMDLRDEWQKLERELPDRSQAAAQLKEAATEGLDRLIAELRGFQRRLRDNASSRRRSA